MPRTKDGRVVAPPDPIDVHVGRAIRARRLALGKSQEALAQACDVSFQQIQKYERGANRVSASMLYNISEALYAPLAEFFPDEHGRDAEIFTAAHQLLAENGGLELAEAYLAMPRDARASLLNVALALRGLGAVRRAAAANGIPLAVAHGG